jgi:phage internal scaffolding protein
MKKKEIKMAQKFRTKYEGRIQVTSNTEGPSLTHQSFQKECDINNIMEKYKNGTPILHLNGRQPQYGDFSHVMGYQEAYNAVIEAQEAFMNLPAKIREQFKNDPGQFIAFVEDPKNEKELIKMGLATERQTPKEGNQVNKKSEAPKGPDQLPT